MARNDTGWEVVHDQQITPQAHLVGFVLKSRDKSQDQDNQPVFIAVIYISDLHAGKPGILDFEIDPSGAKVSDADAPTDDARALAIQIVQSLQLSDPIPGPGTDASVN